MLIVCCDGLTGFPDAIRGHLGPGHRADLHGASMCGSCPQRPQEGRRGTATDLHRPTADAAAAALEEFEAFELGAKISGQRSRPGVTPGNGSSCSGLPARAAQDHLHDQLD